MGTLAIVFAKLGAVAVIAAATLSPAAVANDAAPVITSQVTVSGSAGLHP